MLGVWRVSGGCDASPYYIMKLRWQLEAHPTAATTTPLSHIYVLIIIVLVILMITRSLHYVISVSIFWGILSPQNLCM